jgi:methylglutaconyl-CoA hydratase
MEDRSVLLQVDDRGAAVVTLNRPQIHNAFDEGMVSALTDIFQEVAESNDIGSWCFRHAVSRSAPAPISTTCGAWPN